MAKSTSAARALGVAELLLMLLSNVSHPGDLARAALVGRDWRAKAELVLYRHLKLWSSVRTELVVRTFASRPELAQLVEVVHAHMHPTPGRIPLGRTFAQLQAIILSICSNLRELTVEGT